MKKVNIQFCSFELYRFLFQAITSPDNQIEFHGVSLLFLLESIHQGRAFSNKSILLSTMQNFTITINLHNTVIPQNKNGFIKFEPFLFLFKPAILVTRHDQVSKDFLERFLCLPSLYISNKMQTG